MKNRGELVELLREYDFISTSQNKTDSELELSRKINSIESIILANKNSANLRSLFSTVSTSLSKKYIKIFNPFTLAMHIGFEHGDLNPLKLFLRHFPEGVNENLLLGSEDNFTTPLIDLCQFIPKTPQEKENLFKTFECLNMLGNLDLRKRDCRVVNPNYAWEKIKIERTPLMYACFNGHSKIANYMLNHYPDMLLDRDSENKSVFWYLINNENFVAERNEILLFLINNPLFKDIHEVLVYINLVNAVEPSRSHILEEATSSYMNSKTFKINSPDVRVEKFISDLKQSSQKMNGKIIQLFNHDTPAHDDFTHYAKEKISECEINLKKIKDTLPKASKANKFIVDEKLGSENASLTSLQKYALKIEKLIANHITSLSEDLSIYKKIASSIDDLKNKRRKAS